MLSPPANPEALLDAVPDALVSVDRAGVIQLVHPQMQQPLGYGPDDLVGRPVEVLVPESVRAAHRVHRQACNTAPQARSMGLDLTQSGRRRDGTQFPVDVALSHLDTQDGRLVVAAVRDMTDCQKASQERDPRNRLLAGIEFSTEAIVSVKLEGVITSWNPAAETMFGYKSREIVGRPGRLLSPQDRSEETSAILAKIKAGQAVQDRETMRVRKDGTVFPLSLTTSPICDENGAVIGASATPRDMTRAQHGFESARSMIESNLQSLAAISNEGKITDVSQATVKVTGAPREKFIGTNFAKHFTDPGKADRIYKLVFSKGTTVDYPLTMRHRDGTLTEVLYNASVHLDAAGKVLGVVAAARDDQTGACPERDRRATWRRASAARRTRAVPANDHRPCAQGDRAEEGDRDSQGVRRYRARRIR